MHEDMHAQIDQIDALLAIERLLPLLTPRQLRIIELLLQGYTYREVGMQLGHTTSPAAAKKAVYREMRKIKQRARSNPPQTAP